MNYLTNYYKNLCEQLQDQVNNLSSQLKMLSESAYGGDSAPSAGVVFPPPGTQPGNTPQPNWPYSPSQPTTPPNTPNTPVPPQTPAQAPATTDPGPDRPVPSDYPNSKEDPKYWEDYQAYMKWWRRQSKEYQKANPPPAVPVKPRGGRYERGGAGGGGWVTP